VGDAEARCVSFVERVHGPLAEHDVRSVIAVLRARRSAFTDAREEVGASVATLEELGAAADLAIALQRAAQIEHLAGGSAAAEPLMRRAVAAATHARDEGLRARLAASFAHMLVPDEDRLDEALALADVAEADAADMTTQVGWRMARARVMVRRGRAAHAERLAREGLSLAEQTDSTDLRATALVWAADVRRHAGRPAEAEPLERRALRLFERAGSTAQASALAASLAPIDPTPSAHPMPPDVEPPAEESRPIPEAPDAHASTPPAPEPGATKLADEMMAMFTESEEPAVDAAATEDLPGPTNDLTASTERPTAEIDPTDELLDDPTRSAEEESHRRWFNR